MELRIRSFSLLAACVVAAAVSLPATLFAEGGRVIYSYKQVEVDGVLQYMLVPDREKDLNGVSGNTRYTTAFKELKAAKPKTYLGSTIKVSGSSKSPKISVSIDEKAGRYALIIMGEVVYTMTELGADDVGFPGYATRDLTRADVPFNAYAMTVPLWKALPTADNKDGVTGAMVQIRMPDGKLMPADEVANLWRRKDDTIVNALYDYLDAPETFTITTVARRLPGWRVPYAEKVIPLLGHPSTSVQNTALELLESERDDTRVLEAVRAYLRKEKDLAQATAAAVFLGGAKNAQFSIEEPFFYLEKGTAEQAIKSVQKLGKLKDDRIVPKLEDKLTDKQKPLAMAAAEALEAQNATGVQRKALGNTKIDPSVRLAIAADLADNSDELKLVGFAYRAENGSLDTRLDAIKALGNLKTEEARKQLEDYLDASDELVRKQAATELRERAEPESIVALATAKKDASFMEEIGFEVMLAQPLNVIEEQTSARNTQVQGLAYRALGEKAKTSKIFGILNEGLSNRSPEIRGSAARAIGAFADKKAAEALATVADDKSETVRRDVALALGNFKSGEMVEQLKKYLESGDPPVVAAAMIALGQRKEAFAWETIKEKTKSKNAEVRAAALKSLAALVSRDDKKGVREVISLLSGATSDPEVEVKIAAMEALSTFKDDRAVTSISLNASAEELPLRIAALRALGRSGHPSAREVLVTALGDPEVTVREEAVRALGELGDKAAKPNLQQMLENTKDEDLRDLIQSTLKSL